MVDGNLSMDISKVCIQVSDKSWSEIGRRIMDFARG